MTEKVRDALSGWSITCLENTEVPLLKLDYILKETDLVNLNAVVHLLFINLFLSFCNFIIYLLDFCKLFTQKFHSVLSRWCYIWYLTTRQVEENLSTVWVRQSEQYFSLPFKKNAWLPASKISKAAIKFPQIRFAKIRQLFYAVFQMKNKNMHQYCPELLPT